MTEQQEFDPTQTINTSGILFRMAVQSAKRSEIKGTGEHRYLVEARLREADEFIVTVMMVHAAIEAAWHWEFMINNLNSSPWPAGFFSGEGTKALCAVKSRDFVNVPENVKDAVRELSAWRNFLQHGDRRSRDKLIEFIGTGDFHRYMNYHLAVHMLNLGNTFFAYLSQSTGSQMVGPWTLLWPGWD
jgi:hypothetical protein